MTHFFRAAFYWFILGWSGLFSYAQPPSPASRVVVLVNSNDPKSIELGQYYAQQRGIPLANVIELPLSAAETISWREYVDSLHNPLLNQLLADGWIRGVKGLEVDAVGRENMALAVHSIHYLVSMRGVPLRIAHAAEFALNGGAEIPAALRFNRAAVDSELTLLLAPANAATLAFVPNPYFQQSNPSAHAKARVIPVSRLDGPKSSDVVRLIDRSLLGEAQGLMGRAYIDLGGPHKKGDVWLEAAGDAAKAAFFDTDFERTGRAMGDLDRFDAPAIYMGWYRAHADGPWREPRWTVPVGAIGFHLHSFSAASVRDVKRGWLAAFIAQGYCATVGNVYEPYLEYSHRPDLLLQNLLAGHSFGEAILYSLPVFSWAGVAIGDPLYRPFKLGLSQQLAQAQDSQADPYLILRQLNRIQLQSGDAAALQFARQQFSHNPSLALAYRLAQLYQASGQNAAAVDALRIVGYMTVFAADERVLVQQIAELLQQIERPKLALSLYQRLLQSPSLNSKLRLQLLDSGRQLAQLMGERQLAAHWGNQLRSLNVPPAVK
jgi:uncharacterized protein (TIGR03790 family)